MISRHANLVLVWLRATSVSTLWGHRAEYDVVLDGGPPPLAQVNLLKYFLILCGCS